MTKASRGSLVISKARPGIELGSQRDHKVLCMNPMFLDLITHIPLRDPFSVTGRLMSSWLSNTFLVTRSPLLSVSMGSFCEGSLGNDKNSWTASARQKDRN